jgi:hypothetical protein
MRDLKLSQKLFFKREFKFSGCAKDCNEAFIAREARLSRFFPIERE